MDTTKQIEGNAATTESCRAPAGKTGWLSSRNVLIGAIALGGAAGLFLGWNWLVAVGLASIVVGILPCLVMCAFGLCMHRMGRKDAPGGSTPVPPSEVRTSEKSAG